MAKINNSKKIIVAMTIIGALMISLTIPSQLYALDNNNIKDLGLDESTIVGKILSKFENVNPLKKSAFDITSKGVDSNGNPYMKVKGIAGSSVPIQQDKIYAYVFVTNTDGIYAVASHYVEDSTEVKSDINWHAHQVTLDTNSCISSINDKGKASLSGNTIKVLDTSKPSEVTKAITAELTIEKTGICVSQVFDSLPQ